MPTGRRCAATAGDRRVPFQAGQGRLSHGGSRARTCACSKSPAAPAGLWRRCAARGFRAGILARRHADRLRRQPRRQRARAGPVDEICWLAARAGRAATPAAHDLVAQPPAPRVESRRHAHRVPRGRRAALQRLHDGSPRADRGALGERAGADRQPRPRRACRRPSARTGRRSSSRSRTTATSTRRRSRSTGGALKRLAGPIVVEELAAAAGHTAVLSSSDRAPVEVYALEEGRLRPLSAHNQALFAELALGTVEDITFKSRDGTPIHGQQVVPPDFVRGRRYPTIVWIHGGPNGQDDHSLELEGYGPPLERQLFATHGYVVLAINYRGGTGRGAQFARSIVGRLGAQGGRGPAGGRGLRDRRRYRRSGAARSRRLELRRPAHRLHDRERHALQGRHRRRRQRQPALDLRQR